VGLNLHDGQVTVRVEVRRRSLHGDAPQPAQVRADTYVWLMAEYRGDSFGKMPRTPLAADPGAMQSGTESAEMPVVHGWKAFELLAATAEAASGYGIGLLIDILEADAVRRPA